MNQGAFLQDPFGLAGTLLEGQYRADAVVGEGGFGVVYRGRHLSLDQPIAIKVLKGLDGGDPTINALVLEKFRAEARLLYTLSQSSLHIVRALDFGAATMPSGAWAPFMILEWLEGRSLADDLAERRQRGMRGRSLDEAFAILESVADGLGAAHEQKVAHRDVKPANVFLLAAPASGRAGPQVKVLDFGIAKIMQEGESVGTKGTFASFTWLYAAPEQLDPRLGATGFATDVYAFTLLLTELLTDRRPVDDRDVVAIMKAATDPNRRPTPRSRGAGIPDEVEAVCQRGLAIDPRMRFATISELWAALVAARASAAASSGTTLKPPAAPTLVVPAHGLPAHGLPAHGLPAPASPSLGA
ncbi:MAG: serine/threonine protein kinase, partial [Labilithrix sp.]|nr:serine/threonine protein kinase [Labilithrix sp.]